MFFSLDSMPFTEASQILYLFNSNNTLPYASLNQLILITPLKSRIPNYYNILNFYMFLKLKIIIVL